MKEIKRQVIELAREGVILPICPECGLPLDLDDEALAGKCKSCGAELILEKIPWIETETIPD